MDVNAEFIILLVTMVVAVAGLLWRFETRFSNLSDRVSRIEGRLDSFATKADIAKLEGLLEGYLMRAGNKEQEA